MIGQRRIYVPEIAVVGHADAAAMANALQNKFYKQLGELGKVRSAFCHSGNDTDYRYRIEIVTTDTRGISKALLRDIELYAEGWRAGRKSQ